MRERFKKILKKQQLLNANKTVVLAVSGGVDSIVLFHLLQGLPMKKRPEIIVAHVNHQLRVESEKEAAFVKKLTEKHQIPFYLHTWNKKDQPESGIEEAARHMRYTFFKQVMADAKADILMTAHHQDDQVETILMKLTRGSTLEQITGIQMTQEFNDGLLVRPLLSFSKNEIYDFAHRHELNYVEDATNQALTYSRNRFRNQIIPLLKEENTQFNEHIEQFSKDLKDLLAIAKQPLEQVFQELIQIKNHKMTFNKEAFSKQKEPMQRQLLAKILKRLYKNQTESYKTNYIDILQKWLLEGEVNTQLDLTGNIIVKKDYEKVTFLRKKDFVEEITQNNVVLDEINQWHSLSQTEAMGLFLKKGSEKETKQSTEKIDCLFFDESSLQFPLTVRHRKPGDRMTYDGLAGTKKIKDIFIDEKVPKQERDKAWLVEDANGMIIWLVGYRKMDLLSTEKTDKLTFILKHKIN